MSCCGFCLSRILSYFPSYVVSMCHHRRDISAFLHCARFWTIQTIYFMKGNDTRTSKTMFSGVWRANTQIQIHKYTNTHIQLRSKLQINLTCAIFLKRILFEDLKNNVPRCLTSKYTNTNTQIHKYTNTQIQFLEKSADRHDMCYIFEKLMLRGCQNVAGLLCSHQTWSLDRVALCTLAHCITDLWHKLVGDDISSKVLFLHSSQQVGVQILLVQPHSKTSKQRKTHPHKIICVQYLQQCKNVARIMFMFKTKSRW